MRRPNMNEKTLAKSCQPGGSLGGRIRTPSEKVGQPERRGEIIEVLGDEASPMFKVRWEDGHETVFVPGPDASVEYGS
jgi:uncharacterized protein DUF1918